MGARSGAAPATALYSGSTRHSAGRLHRSDQVRPIRSRSDSRSGWVAAYVVEAPLALRVGHLAGGVCQTDVVRIHSSVLQTRLRLVSGPAESANVTIQAAACGFDTGTNVRFTQARVSKIRSGAAAPSPLRSTPSSRYRSRCDDCF